MKDLQITIELDRYQLNLFISAVTETRLEGFEINYTSKINKHKMYLITVKINDVLALYSLGLNYGIFKTKLPPIYDFSKKK